MKPKFYYLFLIILFLCFVLNFSDLTLKLEDIERIKADWEAQQARESHRHPPHSQPQQQPPPPSASKTEGAKHTSSEPPETEFSPFIFAWPKVKSRDLDNVTSQFLVALPNTLGMFAKSVVLMISHDDKGSFGLILNLPPRKDELQQVQLPNGRSLDSRIPILIGGPVQPSVSLILHSDPTISGSQQIIPPSASSHFSSSSSNKPHRDRQVFLGGSSNEVLQLLAGTRASQSSHSPPFVRLCFGYSSWGGYQLDFEMRRHSWVVCPSSFSLIFETPSSELFDKVVQQCPAAAAAWGIIPGTFVTGKASARIRKEL